MRQVPAEQVPVHGGPDPELVERVTRDNPAGTLDWWEGRVANAAVELPPGGTVHLA